MTLTSNLVHKTGLPDFVTTTLLVSAHMNRRMFLSWAALSSTIPSLRAAELGAPDTRSETIIDTNVYLGSWPVRHSWAVTPTVLIDKLQRHGVTEAWAGSYEAVLHTDIDGANRRLIEACAREGRGILRPFPTINIAFPDWEEDLRRCHEHYHVAGIRLFPGYHGYTFEDASFWKLLEGCAQRNLLVQVVLSIEDDRSQNPQLTAPPIQILPLVDHAKALAATRLMLLNSGSRVLGGNIPILQRLSSAGVFLEIATLEGAAAIESLIAKVPHLKLCFGSYAPYFYFESALLKLRESDLSEGQLREIRSLHAQTALRRQ